MVNKTTQQHEGKAEVIEVTDDLNTASKIPTAFDALAEERIADHFHDECGVFGIYNHEEASHIAYLGLYALQHRGQESAGICTSDTESHYVHRAMGLVADVFEKSTLDKLYGQHAVGHVRYSTAGESLLRNAQPFCAATDDGPVSIAHNGNLVNVD
ncbi:MAG: class II glutamine amidotransferase, partial [Deltaproteobacteria bacterium]|nr:class II glutamine amidotransferase [Deltaproteobacteria bacterium]